MLSKAKWKHWWTSWWQFFFSCFLTIGNLNLLVEHNQTKLLPITFTRGAAATRPSVSLPHATRDREQHKLFFRCCVPPGHHHSSSSMFLTHWKATKMFVYLCVTNTTKIQSSSSSSSWSVFFWWSDLWFIYDDKSQLYFFFATIKATMQQSFSDNALIVYIWERRGALQKT